MTETAVRKVRDEIENSIVSGEFAPGERLDEVFLSTRYGVSRTPVREALMQLSAIGVVELRPRRGAVVVEHGPQRVYEMFEVMAELEGLAGALAARRLTVTTARRFPPPTRAAGPRRRRANATPITTTTRSFTSRFTPRATAAS